MIEILAAAARRPRAAAAGSVALLAIAFAIGSYLPKVEAMRGLQGKLSGPGDLGRPGADPAALEDRLSRVRSRIPAALDLDSLREEIAAAGKSHRLEVADIRIVESESAGPVDRIEAVVSLRGRARDVCEFFEEVKRIERIAGIERFEAAVGAGGILSVRTALLAFREGSPDGFEP